MHKSILILPGDGIGPEVTQEAVKVLAWFNQNSSHQFELIHGLIGGAALDAYSIPLHEETLSVAKEVDSVLLGAVGGPQWDKIENSLKPEKGLLKIREELGLFANLRPIKVFQALTDTSPLKKEFIENLDLMIVRELTGDVYFGDPRGFKIVDHQSIAYNTMCYSQLEIERIARVGFTLAQLRNHQLCSIDKANVLETSQLWRDTVQKIRDNEYPDVHLTHMYVDNAAMQLIRNPKQFDVMLTANLFGDILSDEASMLTGSLGMLPSASFGEHYSLYEPIHGSAPDIANKGFANPIAMILSVAMMLENSFKFHEEAQMIQKAIATVLDNGFRTKDICTPSDTVVSTAQMGNKIIEQLNQFI